MNSKIKSFAQKAALASATAFLAAGSAMAEVSAEVSGAVAQGKTDVAGTGGLILGVIVAIAAVAWIRRIVK